MRLSFLAIAVLIFSLNFALARENSSPADQEQVSAAAVIREINLARGNPSLYATFVAESRPFHMIEHGRAVDEAVRFLKKARPLAAVDALYRDVSRSRGSLRRTSRGSAWT
jgi:hypothetical protein